MSWDVAMPSSEEIKPVALRLAKGIKLAS